MRVIKPNHLSLLVRPYEFQGRFHLGVSALAFAPMGSEPAMFSDISMWKFAAEHLPGQALDTGVPKRFAEYLVSGHAYPPGGMAQGCTVEAQVGQLHKQLLVIGDRAWSGRHPTDPLPFQSMPLQWEHAYGGEDYAPNPLGKGYKPIKINGQSWDVLPNIENPQRPMSKKKQRLDPVGFGPIDQMWPQRAQRVGTYDKKWFETHYPGLPEDIDWRFFNTAPDDQHFQNYLRGDEAYSFRNMHPQQPILTGQLPGIRARCFLTRDANNPRLEECPLQLSTTWFFPDQKRVILIFHGDTFVTEDDGSDIQHAMVAAETLDQSKSIDEYQQIFKLRTHKDTAVFHALNDKQLVPPALLEPDPEQQAMLEALTPENLRMQNMHKKTVRETEATREMIAGHGLDLDIHAPPAVDPAIPEVPPLERLPEFIKELEAQAEADIEKAKEEDRKSTEELSALFAAQGMDFNDIIAEREAKPKGPPTFTAETERNNLIEIADTVREGGGDVAELEEIIADEDRHERNVQGEKALREVYTMTAHEQQEVDPLSQDAQETLQAEVQRLRAAGQSFAGRDLTGANLSGMDLTGADFSDAWMESACLDGTILTAARFDRTVLSRASLVGTQINNTTFEGANLGGATLRDLQAENVSFEEANFTQTCFEACDFQRSNLRKANLSEARFTATRFTDGDLFQTVCVGNDLSGLILSTCRLEQTQFLQCRMEGGNFQDAHLFRVVFLDLDAPRISFARATLDKCVFSGTCRMPEADFQAASLSTVNLRSSELQGANFSEAQLQECDLSESDMSTSCLYRIKSRGCLFLKTHFEHCDARSADLRGALMSNAHMQSADFRGSNFFMADLARVRGDAATRFDGAFMEKARTEPKWKRQTI